MRAMLPDAVRRRLDPAERYGLRATLFALALVLVAVPFGLLLHQVVSNGPLIELDTAAARGLHREIADRPVAVAVLKVVSFLGSPPWFYLTVGLAAAYWAVRRRFRVTAYLAVTTLLGGAVDTAVKVLVDRERPSLEDPIATAFGKSFPSGHAMTSTVCYGVLLLAFLPLLPRRARPYAFGTAGLLVVSVCFSRLALGVHYVTDVVGGVVLGLAWLAAGTAAFSIWRREEGREPVHLTEGVEPEVMADA